MGIIILSTDAAFTRLFATVKPILNFRASCVLLELTKNFS